MDYAEFASKPRSEKVILVTAEASQEVKLFTLHSGSVYSRVTEHFVSSVKDGTVSLTEAANTTLSAGQFYFDITTKTLYVRTSDSSNPKTRSLSLTYKFFWANAPLVLPHDLISGEAVEWEGRVKSIGSLGQQLDDQNTGIVLESSSTLTLENNDGHFDDIFDTMIWEYKTVSFYSWSPSIAITEANKIFEGIIESKDFNPEQITFKVKDFVFRLKNQVVLPLFSTDDGSVLPSILGTPKRRIYGKVKQLQCAGIDSVLEGFYISGTVSTTVGSATMTGASTLFLDELSPGDEFFVTILGVRYKFGIESVESNTSLTLTQEAEVTFLDVLIRVAPSVPWRKRNRRWHIAGHKLRAPESEIDFVYSSNRVKLLSVDDLYPDDSIKINDEYVTIRRISNDQVVLDNSLSPKPIAGDILYKNPVSKVYFQDKELVIDRDWTLTNTTEAILEINELAEFNIAEPRAVGVTLSFTNASRTVTTAATVDLRTILKPRDWIRKNKIDEATYYEILTVGQQSVTLRTAFTGITESLTGLMKNVTVIDDNSLITVNCMGLEVAGEWIKSPAQAVRHLVMNDAGFATVNEASFDEAKEECDYILSLPIPESLGQKSPTIKEVITNINESVFGSLYGNSSWEISYGILNSKKPENFTALKDDDIISFDVISDQKIINAIKVNYRPFIDIFNGVSATEVYEGTSDFVDRMIGLLNSEERTVYLYEQDKSEIIGQRIMFFRSLSNCKVQVKAKLNLATTSVNDKIFLELDRMYKRYGGRDNRKIGVVTGIKKNGLDTEVEFIDLGGIYNRVPSIAPNTASDYASATRNEVIQFGYVLDNDTLTPNVLSELELGNNLIG